MKKRKKSSPRLAISALVISYIIWGLNTPIIKLGTENIEPSIFMAIKLIGASVLILPFAVRHWKPIDRRTFISLSISALIWVTVGSYSQYLGLQLAPSINAAVITLLGPLLLFLLSVEFLKEKFILKKLVGTLISFVGAFIVIGQPFISGDLNKDILIGNLLFLLAVTGHVVGAVIAKPHLKKVSSYQATIIHLMVGGIPVLLLASTKVGGVDFSALPKTTVYSIIYGICAVTLASFLFMYALKSKKTQEIGVYTYIEPLVTVVAAVILLNEIPDSQFVLGALLVFVGIYLVEAKLPKHVHLHYHSHHHH